MRSKTSFFNFTALKKDIFRFAPAWGLYTVGALLVLSVTFLGEREKGYLADTVAGMIHDFMPVVNFSYALVAALLLFGDLYQSRMCNALHAFPLRRESWFAVHTVAGLCFSLVPNTLIACLAAWLLGAQLWPIAFWWLPGSQLQYLFFFGMAVLCALWAGTRFAGAVLYGILNFLSMIVYWFVSQLYVPRLYGVELSAQGFLWFCPVVKFTELPLVEVEISHTYQQATNSFSTAATWELVNENWLYELLPAAVGIAMLGLALVLYRRRKLESAGDFIAFPPVRPAFLLVYTLTFGMVFRLFLNLFVGFNSRLDWIFLGMGVVVGYFTGRMLLQRRVRVFQPKAWLACAGILAALAGSIFLTSLDPFGVEDWVPEPEQVASVDFNYSRSRTDGYTNPEIIAQVTRLHRSHLEDRGAEHEGKNAISIRLTYTMENGRQMVRRYTLWEGTEACDQLKTLYSRPELVLGYDGDWEAYLASVFDVCVSSDRYGEGFSAPEGQYREFLEAIRADAQAGNMTREAFFLEKAPLYYVEIQTQEKYRHLYITQDCENTIAWIEANWPAAEGTDLQETK